MDKNDFKQSLIELVPGQCAAVPYEIFEDLLPPGVEHDRPTPSPWRTDVSLIISHISGKFSS
jgi:hypothetical protein